VRPRLGTRAIAGAVSAALHAAALVLAIAFWPGGSGSPARRSDPARPDRTAVAANPSNGSAQAPQAGDAASRRRPADRAGSDAPDATTLPAGWGPNRVVRASPYGTTANAPQIPGNIRISLVPAAISDGARRGADALLTHLWQSTLFALAIGVVALLFRGYDARLRYWLWCAATVKFLVPFALLAAMGRALPGASIVRVSVAPQLSLALSRIGQPFVVPELASSAALAAPGVDWLHAAIVIAWFLGCEFVAILRLRAWRVVRASLRASEPVAHLIAPSARGLRVRACPSPLEPGVVGLWRPTLLVPRGIETRLRPAELDAVVAHEACHLRYRDNLTAALQMIAEAVFWFHPLVWWIGGRLVQERERACDEHVLRSLDNPRVYADAIVNVCKTYVDARLACVPGVGSSDLRRRIERIMRNERSEPAPRWTRIGLVAAAVATVVVPIAAGAASSAPRVIVVQPPGNGGGAAVVRSFETASVKRNTSGGMGIRLEPDLRGRFTATNAPAALLIRFAYDLPSFEILGGPDWLEADRFDIVASTAPGASVDDKREMLRRLFADRFGLVSHQETRDLPIYALIPARGDGRLGPNLRQSSATCDVSSASALIPGRVAGVDANGNPPACGFFGMAPRTDLPSGRGGYAFRGLTMEALAKTLKLVVLRDVVDRTGLTGYFDGDLDFMAEVPPPPPPPGVPNPFPSPFESVFTLLPQQLGLKLESGRAPVDVLVIDTVAHPVDD
jgi:uncharacterized protein (TIGR03435 family)